MIYVINNGESFFESAIHFVKTSYNKETVTEILPLMGIGAFIVGIFNNEPVFWKDEFQTLDMLVMASDLVQHWNKARELPAKYLNEVLKRSLKSKYKQVQAHGRVLKSMMKKEDLLDEFSNRKDD